MDDNFDFLPEDMNIPVRRRQCSGDNLRWLARNLWINNQQHPQIQETLQALKKLFVNENVTVIGLK